MPEPREPKPTKAQIREARREAAARANTETQIPVSPLITRRRLLLGIGSALGLAAVTATGLAITRNWAPAQGNNSADFPRFLSDLDTRTQGPKGVDLLNDKSKEITERALDQVGLYIGSKPTPIENVKLLKNRQELIAATTQDGGCPITTTLPITALNRIIRNRSAWIGVITEPFSKQAASDVAEGVIHEDIHFRTLIRDFTPDDMTPLLPANLKYHTLAGIRASFTKPGTDPSNPCNTDSYRGQLLEGHVQFSTLQILIFSGVRLGPGGYQATSYPKLTSLYTENIGRLFPQDHKPQILIPFLEAKPSLFFRNMGTRMDPKNSDPALYAERKTVDLFANIPLG